MVRWKLFPPDHTFFVILEHSKTLYSKRTGQFMFKFQPSTNCFIFFINWGKCKQLIQQGFAYKRTRYVSTKILAIVNP